jgi:OFA family oxalate/formate antiporter-like MFS transporter
VTKHSFTVPAQWPFDVRRLPFFYGWAIWALSTLGFLMSIPGQTMGMAVFTDAFIDTLGLSRTQLSITYFFGTLGSALFLTRAGRWYDQLGARTMVVGASLALALVLLFISSLDVVGGAVAAWTGLALSTVTFPLIMLGYFGVRFAGQGVMTSASRNVLLVWFERRRGLVSGTRGVVVSLAFSLAPLLLALLIGYFGWRGALLVMALALGGVFSVLALAFLRDSPESCGLRPDGAASSSSPAALRASGQGPDKSLNAARRSPVFWFYSAGLAIHALFGTAVTFHVVAIFAEVGRDQGEAFGYFLPQALVATSVNLVASWLADNARLNPFLLCMLAAFLLGGCGLLNLQSDWGYWMLVVGFGAGGGLWGVLSNLAFVRHFGRLHLGEISGLNTALTVFASAVGPVMFSLGYDLFGSYQAPALVCTVGLAILLLTASAKLPKELPLAGVATR